MGSHITDFKNFKTVNENNQEIPDLGEFKDVIDIDRLTKNADGTYDYDGYLIFDGMDLKSLLEIPIRFRNITGHYCCDNNKLISLEGAPENVYDGFFWCNNNILISLQYMPNVFNEDEESSNAVDCSQNNLLSKKFKSVVKANINFDNNPLKINDDVIKSVKKMTQEQRNKELDFFKEHDKKAFKMMNEILDNLDNYDVEDDEDDEDDD